MARNFKRDDETFHLSEINKIFAGIYLKLAIPPVIRLPDEFLRMHQRIMDDMKEIHNEMKRIPNYTSEKGHVMLEIANKLDNVINKLTDVSATPEEKKEAFENFKRFSHQPSAAISSRLKFATPTLSKISNILFAISLICAVAGLCIAAAGMTGGLSLMPMLPIFAAVAATQITTSIGSAAAAHYANVGNLKPLERAIGNSSYALKHYTTDNHKMTLFADKMAVAKQQSNGLNKPHFPGTLHQHNDDKGFLAYDPNMHAAAAYKASVSC